VLTNLVDERFLYQHSQSLWNCAKCRKSFSLDDKYDLNQFRAEPVILYGGKRRSKQILRVLIL